MMIRVEGHQNLYRDERSGAIINWDTAAYNQYLKSLSIKDSQKRELNEMRKEIAEIKMADLNCFSMESAMSMVAGTARSMGLKVSGTKPF